MKFSQFVLLLISILFIKKESVAQRYFQQEVNYEIKVELNDEKHELEAFESITYINRSPDTLSFLYFHLWPNAYKNNNTALAKQLLDLGETKLYFSSEKERGYIDKLDFRVNGNAIRWETLKDSIDICKLYLNTPLQSGDSITITTPFHVKLPSAEISRLGHIGQSYQITQWYPKPAVYDGAGWHQMPYLNQGEFYSEFGSFDVSIIVPSNYVVGATGNMVDAEAELEWLNRKVEKTELVGAFDPHAMEFPESATTFKTLRFKQEKVHDFAWFCDKRYNVLKGEVELPNSKKKVTVWAMFTNAEAHLWKNSIEYMEDAIYYYSSWIGDYPYNQCTAVDGTIAAGGGMEYPNVTVIGTSGTDFYLDLVLAHEIGHNWFYGILGSNERRFPWMDEGINSFYESRYITTAYPAYRLLGKGADGFIAKRFDLADYKYKKNNELLYLSNALQRKDQAILEPSSAYTSSNYGSIVYAKSAMAFDYLEAYIGKQKMDQAMQLYFDRWKFKHPSPWSLKDCIEEVAQTDLDWFFNDILGTTKQVDYKISSVTKSDQDSLVVVLKNVGEVASPVFLHGSENGKDTFQLNVKGFLGEKRIKLALSTLDYLQIDPNNNMLDVNRNNNSYKRKGVFKKVEPIKFQFLGSLDHPEKTQIFYTPIAGWNNYNKVMLGMAFYNTTFPFKKFQYQLLPMYSFGTKGLTGYGHLAYNLYPNIKGIQHIELGLTAKRYAYSLYPTESNYSRLVPKVVIDFRKKRATSLFSHKLAYSNIMIHEKGDAFSTGGFNTNVQINDTRNLNTLLYTFTNEHAIKPYSIDIGVLQGDGVLQSSLTGNYALSYRRTNKKFTARVFAGTFINTAVADAAKYPLLLSGSSGAQDFLYDNTYLGRTELDGIWSQQFTESAGAFKFNSPLGRSTNWLTTLNLNTSLGNSILPLNIYADFGLVGSNGSASEKLLYNAGVSVPIVANIVEVYFPLLISQGFQDYITANDIKYKEIIRFKLNFNMLNPFERIKTIEL